MSGNFYIDFWYFIIYSFLGWGTEIVYCSVLNRRVVNRGFLNGPVCPIYGCGALLVIIVLKPFAESIMLVFVGGLILASILEYITSFIMEQLFHTRWWDYSKKKLNINGRVCLLNSVLFGMLSMITIFFIQPRIEILVGKTPYVAIQAGAITLMLVMTIDLTITVETVYNLNEKMQRLKDLSAELKEWLDEKELYIEEKLEDRITLVRTNIEQNKLVSKGLGRLISEFHRVQTHSKFGHRRLINAFPTMKSKHFQIQLQLLKEAIKKQRNN